MIFRRLAPQRNLECPNPAFGSVEGYGVARHRVPQASQGKPAAVWQPAPDDLMRGRVLTFRRGF
jgi:hypothetical protein